MRARLAQLRLRRRLAFSLFVALLIHAAVFLWIRTERLVLEAPRPEKKTLIVKLLKPAEPPPQNRETENRTSRTHRHVHRAAVNRQPPQPVAPERSAEPLSPRKAVPGPIVERRPTPAPGGSTNASPEVRLFDHGALLKSAKRGRSADGAGEMPADSDNSRQAERRRVKLRVDGTVAEIQARDRVASGLIDPYFHTLGEEMRSAFKPRPGQLGGADGDGVAAGVQNLAQGWHSVGKQWARTGSPYADGETPAGLDNSRPMVRPTGGTSGFDAADFAARWNRGEFAFAGGSAVLELTQDARGVTLGIKVLRSSGFRLFDEAAKSAVAEAARIRIPPAHGLGLGGPKIRSVWKLDARIVPNTCSLVTDPTGITKGAGVLPGLSCGGTFDPSLHEAEINTPLKTRVVAHVELLAVYGGEATPAAQ